MRAEFFQPADLAQALDILSQHAPDVRICAGGSMLAAQAGEGRLRDVSVLSLGAVAELAQIGTGAEISLGAMVTLRRLTEHRDLAARHAALVAAAAGVGSAQIRNVGTVGGNICSGNPRADLLPALLADEAVLRFAAVRGSRGVPLPNGGPDRIAPDELLQTIVLPPTPHTRTASAYRKVTVRGAMEEAAIGIALRFYLGSERSTLLQARIAVNGLGIRPTRMPCAEALLIGRHLSDKAVADAADALAEAIESTAPPRTADYQRRVLCSIFPGLAQSCLAQASRSDPIAGSPRCPPSKGR